MRELIVNAQTVDDMLSALRQMKMHGALGVILKQYPNDTVRVTYHDADDKYADPYVIISA